MALFSSHRYLGDIINSYYLIMLGANFTTSNFLECIVDKLLSISKLFLEGFTYFESQIPQFLTHFVWSYRTKFSIEEF